MSAAQPIENPALQPPYGPGLNSGVVVGPRDGCRSVVNCAPGNYANRPAHRRYYDNYFRVPAPDYSRPRRIDGNPAIRTPSAPATRGVSASEAHFAWCMDRYRSFRSSDNTFQPYNGPRAPCVSPY